ncbi:unnamed protein product [Ambrosiozyma monospora]|uniref:Unnamed protein product n=1 Tax=Ambrosiozyma monospora TaxID=43982 RepID=A0A9W7DJ96_AMBMO|nr:unnamed protein product [Ambrosiozyma monospora]
MFHPMFSEIIMVRFNLGEMARNAAYWTGLLGVIPLVLPVHYARLLINSVQSYDETKLKQELSDKAFKKFKELMLDDEIPLDLSLKIWDIVVCQVLDLVEFMALIENKDTHVDKLSAPLKISLRMYPFVTVKTGGIIAISWGLEFKEYPRIFMPSFYLVVLLNLMRSKGINFKRIEVDSLVRDHNHPYEILKDYDVLIDRVLLMSDDVKFNAAEVLPSTPIWGEIMTSLQLSEFASTAGIDRLTGLKEVIINVTHLLSFETINRIQSVLSGQRSLKLLKVKFMKLTSHEESNIILVGEEIANIGLTIQRLI